MDWLSEIAKGDVLRITDLRGNQAVDTLFFNARNPRARYSAMDTIGEQGNLYLSAGTTLLSDEGNPLLAIVADTCGRHDTLGGACAGESNTVRYALEKKSNWQFGGEAAPSRVLSGPRRDRQRIGTRVRVNGTRTLRIWLWRARSYPVGLV